MVEVHPAFTGTVKKTTTNYTIIRTKNTFLRKKNDED